MLSYSHGVAKPDAITKTWQCDRLHRGCDWNINHEYEFPNFGMLHVVAPLWQKDNIDMGEGGASIYRHRKISFFITRAELSILH